MRWNSAVGSGLFAGALILGACAPLRGDGATDGYGAAIADVGDLNRDGVHELAVGAPHAPGPGGGEYGRVYLYSGLSGIVLRVLEGTTSGELFGGAVAGVGDMDGDGFGDVLVGAEGYEIAPISRGRAAVFSGATGAVIHEWFGDLGARFGSAVASAGDYDGDAVPDALVGAPALDGVFGPGAGRVYVLSGADGSELAGFEGLVEGDHLGYQVALAGDVNGDATGDLLLATAPSDPGGGGSIAPKLEGAAGPRASFVEHPSEVQVRAGGSGTLLAIVTGEAVDDAFGAAIGGVGDVDGDSLDDYAVGADALEGPAGLQQGKVYLFSGATHALARTWIGSGAFEHFGAALAGAGDVDLDGSGDLLVGAPNYGNGSDVRPGKAYLLSGATGETLWMLSGQIPYDGFGAAVSGLTNATPQGYDTMAIAAVDGDGLASFATSGYVVVVTPFAFCGSCAPTGTALGRELARGMAFNGSLYVILGAVLWQAMRSRRRRPLA